MAPSSPPGKRKAADAPISPPPVKRKVQSGTTSESPGETRQHRWSR